MKRKTKVVARGHGRGLWDQIKFANQMAAKHGADAQIKFERDGTGWTATISKPAGR